MFQVIITYLDGKTWCIYLDSKLGAEKWIDEERKKDYWKHENKVSIIDLTPPNPNNEVNIKLKWADIRNKRNEKLTSCDWTQLVDAPVDAKMKQRWRFYRQKLRDIPNNIKEINLFEQTIMWPLTPDEEDAQKKK